MIPKTILFWTAIVLSSPASAQEPLSAIDWLSETLQSAPTIDPIKEEISPAPKPGAGAEPITVTPLDRILKDAVGLLSSAASVLPVNFWGDSKVSRLSRLLRPHGSGNLPEVTALTHRILLAELDPPQGHDGKTTMLLARLDHLLEAGALDQAAALLERAKPDEPELFRRWFDVSLLTQRAGPACDEMLAHPKFAPTLPARVFCLARNGDWQASALTLETASMLGQIQQEDADLLAWFLDPELFDGQPDLQIPKPLTALTFTLREATGQYRGQELPAAFLHLDLQNQAGWRQRLLAAERLVRTQALPPAYLLNLYQEGAAAASGGVWERVKAIQKLDAAVASQDISQISGAVPHAYVEMEKIDLEFALAEMFGAPLAAVKVMPEAAQMQYHLILLHKDHEKLLSGNKENIQRDPFISAILAGKFSDLKQTSDLQQAIHAGFTEPPKPEWTNMIDNGRLGEAVLKTLPRLSNEASSDFGEIQSALATLIAAGLTAEAKRIAVQLLILDRRG